MMYLAVGIGVAALAAIFLYAMYLADKRGTQVMCVLFGHVNRITLGDWHHQLPYCRRCHHQP